MADNIEQVKELRDRTGISVMQCKKALEETGGDLAKALIILQKKGAEVAAKKSDRNLGAGVVTSYIHAGGGVGAMIELFCETDFVSGNEEFKKLAHDIAMQVAATSPKYLSDKDITDEVKNQTREVFLKEVQDKPKDMQDKILEGKVNAYFKEKVLLNQPFIKNPDQLIKDLIDGAVQKFGERIEIGQFIRFSIK